MVFAIDISGSMCPYIYALAGALHDYVDDFQGTSHRFALVEFPGTDPLDPWHQGAPNSFMTVVTDFVDVATFQSILGALGCEGGASEPSIDVMWLLTDPSNPQSLSWRSFAYPYVVGMTDEEGQTWVPHTFAGVGLHTSNCGFGGCVAGDKVEVFLITASIFFQAWLPAVYGDRTRLIEIEPADTTRYLDNFRAILSNVCR
jgi:hypothetical protein